MLGGVPGKGSSTHLPGWLLQWESTASVVEIPGKLKDAWLPGTHPRGCKPPRQFLHPRGPWVVGQQCWGAQAGEPLRSFTGDKAARKWPEWPGVLGSPDWDRDQLRWPGECGLAGQCTSLEGSENKMTKDHRAPPWPRTAGDPPPNPDTTQGERTRERGWRGSPINQAVSQKNLL